MVDWLQTRFTYGGNDNVDELEYFAKKLQKAEKSAKKYGEKPSKGKAIARRLARQRKNFRQRGGL
jgi:hypothetical protein